MHTPVPLGSSRFADACFYSMPVRTKKTFQRILILCFQKKHLRKIAEKPLHFRGLCDIFIRLTVLLAFREEGQKSIRR